MFLRTRRDNFDEICPMVLSARLGYIHTAFLADITRIKIHEEYLGSFQQARNAYAFHERMQYGYLFVIDDDWKFRKWRKSRKRS
jgi:hypothetical protein